MSLASPSPASATETHVLVAGGGAAGFYAAIMAAELLGTRGRVILCEATAHPLAKVRISGGGRCNVTHACFDPRELIRRYPRGGRELLGAFHRFGPRDTVAWFEARGVTLKTEEDGRMFPISDDSATIVDCLMRAASQAGVSLRTGSGLSSTSLGEGGARRFRVTLTSGETIEVDRLVLATGGVKVMKKASVAEMLGHSIVPPVPSLFTFHIDDERLRGLSGLSVGDVVTSVLGPGLFQGTQGNKAGEGISPEAQDAESGEVGPGPAQEPEALEKGRGRQAQGLERLRERGPLLVTHWGLSGPAVLKLSAWGARELAAWGYQFSLVVNFAPPHTVETARGVFVAGRVAHSKKKMANACPLELPGRLWERLIVAAGIDPELTWSQASNETLAALARQVVAAEFVVKGKSLFKEEFVTCGGVRLRDVDFRTMESRLCPGLFFAGEILDIDGITGGFNFQAAWSTGWLAGRGAAASHPVADSR